MNATKKAGFPRLPLPKGGTAIASQWTVPTTERRAEAITAALSAMPPAPGLQQFSVFRGTEDQTVFLLSQWDGTGARDTFLASNSAPRAEVDREVPQISRDWREMLSQYKSFATENQAKPGVLVVVRQPLRIPDPDGQADWVNTVMAALSSEPAPDGLVSATFFVSADAAAVVNLAGWTTAEAHRDVLAKGPRDSQSSLGASAEWMAVRRHPAIASGHSVRRYRFAGAVAPPAHENSNCRGPPPTTTRDTMNKIAIIVGSTRPGRRAGAVAQWIHRLAESHGGAEYTVVDLADFALPMLDEAVPAAMSGNYQQDHTKAWSTAIGLFDGYIFVTPEYNHSITGALKNALDYLYEEWSNKAAAFVGYGTQGGTRAVEHLRHIASELGLAHVRSQVELSIFRDFTSEGIASTARLERSVIRMLDELTVWTQAMRMVRESLSTPGDALQATSAFSAPYAIK